MAIRKQDIPPPSSRELLIAAQQGDSEAFATLYEDWQPKFFAYGLRHNLKHLDAEDFAGDVLLKIALKLPTYKPQTFVDSSGRVQDVSGDSWGYRVARNHLIDNIRGKKQAEPIDIHAHLLEHPHMQSDIEDISDKKTIEDAMLNLTEDQAHVVELRFRTGYTVSETAARMGKTEDAVKKLQARGLTNLRRQLMGDFRPAFSSGINIDVIGPTEKKKKIPKKAVAVVSNEDHSENGPAKDYFGINKSLVEKSSTEPIWQTVPPEIKTIFNLTFLMTDQKPDAYDLISIQQSLTNMLGITDTTLRHQMRHWLDILQNAS